VIERRITLTTAALVLVAILLAPTLPRRSPDEILDPARTRNLPPGSTLDVPRVPPGGEVAKLSDGATSLTVHRLFLLGTDHLGRDLGARLLHGLRNSVVVGLLAAALSVAFGALVGLLSGYSGRRIDTAVMRTVDLATALPKLFVVLAVAASVQPRMSVLIALLASLTWMPVARTVRGEMLALAREDFILAARASGSSLGRLLLRHVLPHLAEPLLTLGALQVANLVLLESALSFLGAGLPLPTASLGGMVAEALLQPETSWWALAFPGFVLTAVGVGCGWAAARLADSAPG